MLLVITVWSWQYWKLLVITDQSWLYWKLWWWSQFEVDCTGNFAGGQSLKLTAHTMLLVITVWSWQYWKLLVITDQSWLYWKLWWWSQFEVDCTGNFVGDHSLKLTVLEALLVIIVWGWQCWKLLVITDQSWLYWWLCWWLQFAVDSTENFAGDHSWRLTVLESCWWSVWSWQNWKLLMVITVGRFTVLETLPEYWRLCRWSLFEAGRGAVLQKVHLTGACARCRHAHCQLHVFLVR